MTQKNVELIVLTGGPGAGKTATLEFIRKILCAHVAVLPEAAGILFSGGFWRLETPSAVKSAQRAIYHVQNEMQKLVVGEAKWSIGLCDRGTLDGLAYWPGPDDEYFGDLKTSFEKEYSNYHAVIHLRSPSTVNGYNHQNPIRTETAEVAHQIDNRIHRVWKGHPNYLVVESTENFMEKVNIAVRCIESFIPVCCNKARDTK